MTGSCGSCRPRTCSPSRGWSSRRCGCGERVRRSSSRPCPRAGGSACRPSRRPGPRPGCPRSTTSAAITPPVLSASTRDRQPRQVHPAEDVVLLAEDRADGDHRDRDDQAGDPDPETLAGAREPGHPARDVPAGVVADHQHDQQDDRRGQADRADLRLGLGLGDVRARADGRGDRADDAGQQHADGDGDQPAEERGAGVQTAEALLADGLGRGRVMPLGVALLVAGPGRAVVDDGRRR